MTLGQQQVHFEFKHSNYLIVTFVRMVFKVGILVSDGYSVQIQPVCTLYRHSHRRGKASFIVAVVYLCIHLNFPSECASGFERCECRFASLQAENLLLS